MFTRAVRSPNIGWLFLESRMAARLVQNREYSMTDQSPGQALQAARQGDAEAFDALTGPLHHELLVHGYRMLGSSLEAEDAVQESLLRAWKGLHTFTQDGSFRAWLYKITTNTCLNALEKRRRTLPTMAYPPSSPDNPLPAPELRPRWLEPMPDTWLQPAAASQDPERRYLARENVRLAFIAVLQMLPPRQRAVLILRDVLLWRASEVAELLEMSVSAANSALHRARQTLAAGDHQLEARPAGLHEVESALLARYLEAWEAADIDGLTALLKEEATFSMPPWPVWYRGRPDIRAALARDVFTAGADQYRLAARRANGQPAFAIYRRGEASRDYAAFAMQVLEMDSSGESIAGVTAFINPALFPLFNLPAQIRVRSG